MNGETAKDAFTRTTKTLHWLIALHMIGLIALGWWMIDLSFYSSWYYLAPFLHKAFGVAVFILGLILLITRFRKRPAPIITHTGLEHFASKTAHWLLFASIIAIPVSGYIFTTYTGEPVSFFNLFDIPAILSVSETVRDLAIDFHIYASYGLLAVIGAHVGGALKHHFVDRDRTLRRMTW